MRRFLRRLGAFAAVQLVIGAVVLWAYRIDRESYFAAVIDKHERLEQTPPGRILFTGGSSVTFGTDSPRVSKALGRPVVNLALHGAFGLPYILSEAEAAVEPGDVVVLTAEYPHFRKELTSDYLFYVIEQRPASVAYLSWQHFALLLDRAHSYAGNVLRYGIRGLQGRDQTISNPPYVRRGFNAEGDLVAHWDLGQTPKGGKSVGNARWRPTIFEPVVRRLNAFHRNVRSRGGEVYMTYAVVSEPAFERVAKPFEELHRALLRECTIPVLDTPAQAVLPRDHFYDTEYHLNGKGVQRRMDWLIPALREHLN